MSRRTCYDIGAKWDDPFEHYEERQSSERFPVGFKFNIRAVSREGLGYMVGPAMTEDLSLGGSLIVTKHELRPSYDVEPRKSI